MQMVTEPMEWNLYRRRAFLLSERPLNSFLLVLLVSDPLYYSIKEKICSEKMACNPCCEPILIVHSFTVIIVWQHC